MYLWIMYILICTFLTMQKYSLDSMFYYLERINHFSYVPAASKWEMVSDEKRLLMWNDSLKDRMTFVLLFHSVGLKAG